MKKIISLFLTLFIMLSLVGCAQNGEKPYKDLTSSDIISATVTLSPPNTTIKIEDVEKLVSLLRNIVIYEEDNSYGEYMGQGVLFTLTLTDGTTQEVLAYNPFFVINGKGYKTEYEPCEKLNNYANELLDQAVDIKDYEKTVSYAGWSEDDKIFSGCLNLDQMHISSVKHCPVFKVSSCEDLENFKLSYGDVLSMNHSYDEVPSFEDATSKYDENFFKSNTLFIVYVTANSGSYRFDVDNVYCDDNWLRIHIKQTNNPESVTQNMAGWFVTVAVKNDVVDNCRFFDADLQIS